MLPPVSPVKSISLSPKDSKQSKIPSLSLSKSILSFIPSLSKSLGHELTGIFSDSTAPGQSSIAPDI